MILLTHIVAWVNCFIQNVQKLQNLWTLPRSLSEGQSLTLNAAMICASQFVRYFITKSSSTSLSLPLQSQYEWIMRCLTRRESFRCDPYWVITLLYFYFITRPLLGEHWTSTLDSHPRWYSQQEHMWCKKRIHGYNAYLILRVCF